jgi:type VI secretion system protein ImpH
LKRLADAGTQSSGEGARVALKIQPELNLDYPESEITGIARDEKTGAYRITTTFFGLYGVSSPLPGYYTEELLDDEWDDLRSRKDFFDVIHNHLYPLLYQAWLKYKLAHNLVEFDGRKYAEIIFSLIGLGREYRSEDEDYGSLLRFAGLLSQRTRSLLGLKTLLQHIADDVAIDIRPCLQRKVSIVDKQRCLLGRQNATLGDNACIGKEVVDRNGKFGIDIGPLTAEQFQDFIRGHDLVRFSRRLLRIYMVQPLEYSVRLILAPGAARPACLGDEQSSLLGSNCWISSKSNESVEHVELVGTALSA